METSTTNIEIAKPVARWFALAMTVAMVAAGAAQFISIGTRQANLWALGLVVLPLAVWWDAARVRARAGDGPANRILMAWTIMQMVLWLLAMYAADLAQGVGCAC